MEGAQEIKCRLIRFLQTPEINPPNQQRNAPVPAMGRQKPGTMAYVFIEGMEAVHVCQLMMIAILAAGAVLVQLMLGTLLLSLAAGLYALRLPVLPAVILSIFHSALLAGFAAIITIGACQWLDWGFSSPYLLTWFQLMLGFLMSLFAIVLNAAALAAMCNWTANLGIMALSRIRRPGVYEPEHATSLQFEYS